MRSTTIRYSFAGVCAGLVFLTLTALSQEAGGGNRYVDSLAVSEAGKSPKITQHVNDFTNTLSYVEWSSLEQEIKTFEDSTSTQIVVMMVSSLNGGSIEDVAVRAFEKIGIGQKGKDNGVLLLIAKEDRKVRIEVGYGLEGVLTDAITSQIIRKELTPPFRERQYYAGIVNAVNAIMLASAGEYKADSRGRGTSTAVSGLLGILFMIFFFIVLPALRSRRRYSIGGSGSRYYGGWGGGSGGFGGGGFFSGGGGGGGGGFGGFSGGGGMSGGGGASGSW